jgi:hypothetical protein
VGEQLNPARDHWVFGWETGRLARSLASGHGLWFAPFRLDRSERLDGSRLSGAVGCSVQAVWDLLQRSANVILSLNCLFAALTCFPLRSIARTAFGDRTGVAAAWAWAVFPYSFDFAAGLVWSTALNALLFTFAVAVTIALERKPSPFSWAAWGVMWGVIGLTEPSLLACLPVAGVWLVARERRRGMPWIFFWRTGFAALMFVFVVSPWFVRNERVFGGFIPFRNNFWLAFYQGNTWDTSDVYPDWANPPHHAAEMMEYARVGEVAYMAEKKLRGVAEVRQHPMRFAWTTVRRIIFTWTGYWSLSSGYRRMEPFALPNILMVSLLSVFAARGLTVAFRRHRRFAGLFAALLVAFPAVYYITHPSMAYRHPVDPVLVLLGVSAFTVRNLRPETRAEKSDSGVELSESARALPTVEALKALTARWLRSVSYLR